MRVVRKVSLPLEELDELVREASAEGYAFLATAQEEWESGKNRFDGEGEAFYAVYEQEHLVAVGGLNRDPFLNAPDTGRLRRIYVRAPWRRQGMGRALVEAMLADARLGFRSVRLRADNPGAARLYESFGFQPYTSPSATHYLDFGSPMRGE